MASTGDSNAGPVVFVSGGAGNLGRSVVGAFLEAGWRVAVALHHTDRNGALDPLAAAHPGRLHSFLIDLTKEMGAESAVRQTAQWGGRIDAVAHLMGAWAGGEKTGEAAVGTWDAMMELNLRSAFLLARAAIPRMLEGGGGSLVFVSSRSARTGRSGMGAYAVAKAGLIVLAETIAEEYRQQGVRANCVLPGTIDTPANRSSMPDADHARWTPPDEIARAIVFLASPASSAVNGAAVPVYGKS